MPSGEFPRGEPEEGYERTIRRSAVPAGILRNRSVGSSGGPLRLSANAIQCAGVSAAAQAA